MLDEIGKILLSVLEQNAFMFGENGDLSQNNEKNENQSSKIYCNILFRKKIFLEIIADVEFCRNLMMNMGGFDEEIIEREIKTDSYKKTYWEKLSMDTLGEIANMVMGNFLKNNYDRYDAEDLSIPFVKKIDEQEGRDLLEKSSFKSLLIEEKFPLIIFMGEKNDKYNAH